MQRQRFRVKQSIIDSEPTGYSGTTSAELRSVKIFWGLIDNDYIKGKPEAMDKNPNHDGIFEFTTAKGIPVGNFAVQIKTLQKRNYGKPGYQCKLGFISYCNKTNIPVLLIAVNQEQNVVHWRHIDTSTINEAQSKIVGQSVMISFPEENVIADGRNEYINAWQTIIEQDVLLRRNADSYRQQHEELEADYTHLREQLAPPIILNREEVAAFQRYLDRINEILDGEFPALKAVAYPDYWKIGIAVTDIAMGERCHFLIPIAYGSNELLVRQFDVTTEQEMFDVFHQKGAFVLIGGDQESIKRLGEGNAYNAVKSALLRAFKQAPLYVPDAALANEYLAGFTETFFALLGLDKKDDVISLNDLQFLLTAVLPVAHENEMTFIADGVTSLSYSLDLEKDRAPKPYYKQRIEAAKLLLKTGYLPRYRTDIYSGLFSMRLVHQYITLLVDTGQMRTIHAFASDTMQRNHVPMHIGIRNLALVQENLRRFFARLPESYEHYLKTNFYKVQEVVDFFEDSSLLVFVLQTIGHAAEKPYLECYRIHDERVGKRRMLFYTDTDTDNPMDRKRWLIDRDPTCVIYGQTYVITSVTVMTLEFLFERSPTFAFIDKQILRRLEPYLDKKARGKTMLRNQ